MNPQVIGTSPKNYETDVATNTPLTAEFNADLYFKDGYLEDYVYLTDSRGVRIDGRLAYRKKKIVFTPLAPLEPGVSHQLFLIGQADLSKTPITGIKSILDEPMKGNVIVNFTTAGDAALDPPELLTPADGVLLREAPAFGWAAVEGAKAYAIQIASSNRFDDVIFTSETADLEIEPNELWSPGLYYWRVKTIPLTGADSGWSASRQFHLTDQEHGTIAEEDAPQVEVLYEEIDRDLEIVEVFPADGLSDVPTNVKSIYFRVIGDVDVSLIDVESFSIVGKHITGDPTEDSHGEVKGVYAIVQDSDGTTYIVFTPDPLPVDPV